MLPRLLDTAGFQSAAQMTPDEFATAALAGLVPRAVGMLANVPLWQEHIVQTFCKEAGREFNSEWSNGNASMVVDAARATAVPVVESPQLERDLMEFPEEMTQVMAARYCDCSPGLLDKHSKDGLLPSRKEGLFVIYRKADLDAFMELAVFKYRKRVGYTAGKPNGKPTTRMHAPKGMELPKPINADQPTMNGCVLLSEQGAADHLGIHPEALAIARREGNGPTCSTASGQPRYRIADLDAWRAEQDATTPPARHVSLPEHELSNADAAEYLGVSPATMGYWRSNNTGPAIARREGGEGARGRGVRVFYTVGALEEFKRTHHASIVHSQRMRANPNVQGPRRTTGNHHGNTGKRNTRGHSARPTTGPMHPAAVKSVTPSGSRIRH